MPTKRHLPLALFLAAVVCAFAPFHVESAISNVSDAPAPLGEVVVITIDGVINPISAEFIKKSISKANASRASAIVIELDTPGGLDTSMRSIVKDIVSSEVPIITYVSPGGARAASAGAFILMASHLAAMSPQTNVGAAHPVGVGEQMDKTMSEKATNDAAAYIKSLAEKHGRNAKWAEDAVRKSVSATEAEALKLGIIDLIANDTAQLLSDAHGRTVETIIGPVKLATKGAPIRRQEVGLRHKILDLISNPSVAYILMLLGFYGLLFELTNPGAIFPGVMGGICLILAFYAFQTLPVNYAGLMLIILAVILFVLEIKIVSHGVLTIGGIIAMIFGSIMLFESAGPFFKLSLSLVLPAVGVTALFFTVTLGLAYKAMRRKPTTGPEGIVGEEGSAQSDVSPEGGMVKVRGELWRAVSDTPIKAGEAVVIESVSGLKVKVRKKHLEGGL